MASMVEYIAVMVLTDVVKPWRRRLAAGLFRTYVRGRFHVSSRAFVVDELTLQDFSLSASVFPYQYHSTSAPLIHASRPLYNIRN